MSREPCMCGAPDCRHCFPDSYRQARAELKAESAPRICAGCGEAAEANDAGDSVCCGENFQSPREDEGWDEEEEPCLEDWL